MNKYIYTKEEIATFLRDYNNLILASVLNPSIKFSKIFLSNLNYENRLDEATPSYYNTMTTIFEFMLASKLLTILYDNAFDYLDENSINSMKIPKEIFVNEADYNKFSKKQILKFIRNALNHNDNQNHDLVRFIKIIDNGEEKIKIEINLKNTKPIPFNIILDLKTLLSLSFEINKANTINIYSLRSNGQIDMNSKNAYKMLDKIFIRKFYSIKKIASDQLSKDHKTVKDGTSKGKENTLAELNFEYKDFYLTIPQRVKIEEDLKEWENLGENGNDLVHHLIGKVLPFAIFKHNIIMINIIIADCYVKGDLSLKDFASEGVNIFLTKKVSDDSPLKLYVKEFGIDDILYDTHDYDYIWAMASSIYYGYLFDTCVYDNIIMVTEEKKVERAHIRNSFVHLRWFKGLKDCFWLYDWGNKLNDEFNPDSKLFWKFKISAIDMIKCAENYYKRMVKKDNTYKDDNGLKNEKI